MGFWRNQSILSAFIVAVVILGCCLCASVSDAHEHHHGCNHDHGGHYGHDHDSVVEEIAFRLPEELAEEEFLRTHGFSSHHHDHLDDSAASELSSAGLWFQALGCSLLVSMASLICLIILPVIFIQGKPSKGVVDALALFGAGAMLGDAFLHQLPHAFGGEHSESSSHGHHMEHDHHHEHVHNHSHSHSLEDLSVGLSILGGIVLFLIVEKIVRYVEDHSDGNNASVHGHHHHHHTSNKKFEDGTDDASCLNTQSLKKKDGKVENILNESGNGEKTNLQESLLRKRSSASSGQDEKIDPHLTDDSVAKKSLLEEQPVQSPSNLVFGYLNLFSDGVHNFTDGMALGSAFLLYGSVGGWSRTLFLLAHELPQEVGDFGILVRSGFSVSKALFFNFLSALVALAGTALVLLWGQNPGQSSIIEGFTAGGFIYIAVAGVLAEMNSNGSTKLKSTAIQLVSLILGMTVALCISLVE